MSKSDGHTTDTKLPSPNGLNGVTLSPLSADSNVQSMAVRYPVSRDDNPRLTRFAAGMHIP